MIAFSSWNDDREPVLIVGAGPAGATAARAFAPAGGPARLVDQSGGITLVARDGRTFTARTMIAADGVHSVVARRLGLNPGWPATHVALDMMEETPRTALRDVDPSALWVAYGYDPDANPRGR